MATITEINSSRSLDEAIQALPQELQDIIFGLTVAFVTPATISIDEAYKPPVGLQLNRRIRAQFAREYYGTAIVKCNFTSEDFKFLSDWLVKIPHSHLKAVQTIRITGRERPLRTHFGSTHIFFAKLGRVAFNYLVKLRTKEGEDARGAKLEGLRLEFDFINSAGDAVRVYEGDYSAFQE